MGTSERKTGQKRAIHDVLKKSERPLSAQEIVAQAETEGVSLGLATVYRNVRRLVEDGVLQTIEFAGEPARYERADHQHHHHFRCDRCNKVFDVHGCTHGVSRDLEARVPPGFVVSGHEVWLHGTCSGCAEAPTSTPFA